MAESGYTSSITLLLVILNPFALSVYLFGVLREHSVGSIAGMLARALIIATTVLGAFAVGGERLLTDLLQVRFFAFQVFGGIVFLIIGLKFVLEGAGAMVMLRGEPAQLATTVAMPFLIGPGTVSASALAGVKHGPWVGVALVGAALLTTGILLLIIKLVFDRVKERNAALLERYAEVAGRVSGFLAGSISVEMIASGVELWITSRGTW
jgi:small neutral amino acid transporter SnatA (MarC family)